MGDLATMGHAESVMHGLSMKTHKNLDAWKLARVLVCEVYRFTATFPVAEGYGLKAQLRRASVSVISNIAEGAGRGTRKEFSRFIGIARGSLAEIESQLILVQDLGIGNPEKQLTELVSRMFSVLTALRNSLNAT